MLKLENMTKILVDTSALLAILSVRDRAHKIAKQIWDRFVLEDVSLYTHNYLIVEASALIQNRLGMNATQDLHRKILPVLEIEWITHQQHQEIINTCWGVGPVLKYLENRNERKQ